jgi:hypothetical protein
VAATCRAGRCGLRRRRCTRSGTGAGRLGRQAEKRVFFVFAPPVRKPCPRRRSAADEQRILTAREDDCGAMRLAVLTGRRRSTNRTVFNSFRELLVATGAHPMFRPPYTWPWNRKLERFWHTLDPEWVPMKTACTRRRRGRAPAPILCGQQPRCQGRGAPYERPHRRRESAGAPHPDARPSGSSEAVRGLVANTRMP